MAYLTRAGSVSGPPGEFRPTTQLKWQILIAKEPGSLILANMTPVKHPTFPMSEQVHGDPVHVDTEIELLARETHMPRDLVAKLYTSERAKLELTARIKTFVPVLIHRHVKDLLREQYRA